MTVLGVYPVGIEEPAAFTLDLFNISTSSLSDAVLLVEAYATDGVLTVTGGSLSLGIDPLGTMPGTVTGGDVTLQWSDVDWTSGQTDTRANIHFEGRLSDITIDRVLPLAADGERRVAATVGDISIDNADGAFDGFERSLAIDGRNVIVSVLQSRATTYANKRTLLAGIGRAWRADTKTLHLTAVSQGYLLDQPMLGTYTGAGGATGGVELKGKVIPEICGLCRGVKPVLVDAAKLIYQLHAREIDSIIGVYVRAAPVTLGTPRASYAVLDATSPTGGTFDWVIAPTGSFIRLGSSPDGTVTCDVRGDAVGGYSSNLPSLMRKVIGRAGQSVNVSAFDSAEAFAPGIAGILFSEQTTFAAAVSSMAAGAALWWGDAGDGTISVSRLSVVASTGLTVLDQESIVGEVQSMQAPEPLWKITSNYRKNWSVLSGTDIVPSPTISEARRLEVAEENRKVSAAIPERLIRNASAKDLVLNTLYDEEADALALANNMLSLYAPGIGLWTVSLGLNGFGLRLGEAVRLIWPRMGLANGRDLRIVGQASRGRNIDLLLLG